MTFDFFNDIFNINTGVKLSNGSFTFNYRGINGIGTPPPPPELIKEWFGYPIQTAYSLAGDLINWKLYGNSVQRLLPEGFTPLAYIESTGTQWIDTGYIFTSENEKITADFQVTDLSYGAQDKFLLGTQNADISKGGIWVEQYRYSGHTTTGNWFARFGSSLSAYGFEANQNVRYQIELSKNTFKLYSGSTFIGNISPNWIGTFQNTPLTIFGRFSSSDDEFLGTPSKFWSLKIQNGNTLTLNLIPAKRKSDSAIGMYDVITNTFFTNAGTGSFIAGPEVPAPDSPIEIKSVGDKTKNLFDKSKAVLGDISSTTGEPVSTFTYRFVSDFIKVNEGDTISFSGKMMYVDYPDEYDCSFIKAFYDSDKNFISGSRASTTTPLTIPTGASYVRIEGFNSSMSSGKTVVLDSLKVMIVEGSTTPTSYVPYGYQIPVNVSGKNLFDVSTATLGYINDSGVENTSTASYRSVFIPCKPNTSYVVRGTNSANGGYLRLHQYSEDNNSSWISMLAKSNGEEGVNTVTGTTSSNAKYIRISGYLKGRYGSEDFQLEQGSTATSYEPYHKSTTPVYLSNPLRKIGTYADYIDYENQQVVRNIGIKVLDGVTDGLKFVRVAPLSTFYFSAITQSGITQNMSVRCTHFINKNVVANNVCYAGTNTITFHHSFPTLEDANTWLASEYAKGTPVIVVYPLATPVTEPLTVPALTMAKGTNIITCDCTISPSDMYAKGKVSQL